MKVKCAVLLKMLENRKALLQFISCNKYALPFKSWFMFLWCMHKKLQCREAPRPPPIFPPVWVCRVSIVGDCQGSFSSFQKKNTFSAIYSFDNFCGSGKSSELSSTPHASWLVEICEHRHESMSWNSKWLLHSCRVGSVYFVYSIHNVNIGVANSRAREPESCRF